MAERTTRFLRQAALLAFLFTAGCDLFHSPGYDWSACFDGSAGQIHELPGGGYILVQSRSTLLRLDSRLRLKQSISYGNLGYGYICSVVVTPDTGFLVTGDAFSAIWLVKADSRGGVQWKLDIARLTQDRDAVRGTIDGGYVVTGGRDGLITLIKVSPNGSVEWEAPGDSGVGCWVVQTADCGYLVASSRPARLCKFDSARTIVWTRNLKDIDVTTISHAYLAPDGECLIGTGSRVVRLDGTGNVVWERKLPAGIVSMQPASDRGFIVAGGLDHDIVLIKIDSAGNEEWSRTYGGKEYEYCSWGEQTADGGYIVAGTEVWENCLDLQRAGIRLKKTDADGN